MSRFGKAAPCSGTLCRAPPTLQTRARVSAHLKKETRYTHGPPHSHAAAPLPTALAASPGPRRPRSQGRGASRAGTTAPPLWPPGAAGSSPSGTLLQRLGLQGPGEHRCPAPPNRSPPKGEGGITTGGGVLPKPWGQRTPPPLKTGQHRDTSTVRPGTRGPVNRNELLEGPRGRAASMNVPFWDSCRCSFSW